MRVAFDARVLEDAAFADRGIGRYAQSLLDAFGEQRRDVVALRELGRPWAPERVAEFLEHVLLARDVRRAGASILHSPSIDFVTRRPGVPYVVTVHDLVPLKHPDRYLRTGVKHRARYAAVKRATRVIVPTQAVARDCQELLGIDADRIDVIPEAAAPGFRLIGHPRALLERWNFPARFILWVGGLDPPDPRKQVERLAAAVRRGKGAPLVLVGAVGPEALSLASVHRVRFAGRVTDEELAALYNAADCLVVASEEEGFGLPVVEALACGTPVAAFAIEAMRELHSGQPAVRLVEPGDFEGLLAAADELAGARASRPARTWTDVARDTWAAYERCVGATT